MMLSVRLLTLAVVAANLAWCAEPFYIGSWKIASATVAPWWEDAKQKPDAAESKTLVGQTFAFEAKRITGPRQIACKSPHYEVKNYPADMLFQGMFGEMHSKNPKVDPAVTAASVGFKGKEWKTMETGCGNELDYHFLDERTAAFGLNNYIFILKKL